ncbi:MAG: hypothetical protein CUN50_00795 [Candidatus Thermofonsia Clade 1 bacterium]|uniref:Uncharacterized protein n=1 Tax=Candidatus Thermofonsia Clade 1 bacterium TaxID=2364210 RepID=A0A2M8Q0F7_9CHLR|nr:MAG: hypothetical protein CUN50_00795 [Candidatus Thermofonsia Clade 1 bacterium]
MTSIAVLRYGAPEPPPELLPLHAGNLSMFYHHGDLRRIRFGEREVLQRIYVAVRDENWETIPFSVSDLHLERAERAFRLTFTAHHAQGDIRFRWQAEIVGMADSTLRFSMAGEALSAFRRNRIGICVLHPAHSYAELPVQIEMPDGACYEARFPRLIAPEQPFLNVRAMTYQLGTAQVTLHFDGDIFETEDQRNWSDASFKTYSTPLSLPRPVSLPLGAQVQQAVTLHVSGEIAESHLSAPLSALHLGEFTQRLPSIGLCVAKHGDALSPRQIERLRALNLAHLRVDLRLGAPNWRQTLRRATLEARALNVPLEIALYCTADAENELSQLTAALSEFAPPVLRWLIFSAQELVTPPPLLSLARRLLLPEAPSASFAAGSHAQFAELNMSRYAYPDADGLVYALNPQVHAEDHLSLMENLAAQADTALTARQFGPDKQLHLSPITLKPRFNPNAVRAEVLPAEALPRQVDPRQTALIGAAWTLGSLAALCSADVHSLTYYETSGWRGVLEREGVVPHPRFPSLMGAVFPLYHVFADVGEFAAAEVAPLYGQAPELAGMALRKANQTRLLLANLSHVPQLVRLVLSGTYRVRILDESSALQAMLQPESFRVTGERHSATDDGLSLTLLPYAVATLDAVSES